MLENWVKITAFRFFPALPIFLALLLHLLLHLDMLEWDEDKRQRNIIEHSVDFRVAVRIFNNPVIESMDEREEYEEIRYRALGHDKQQYYMVAYTWWDQNRRIISAWKVGKNGKKRYENILFGRN